jgi:predicted HTH transcriptional regulator
MVSFDNGNRIIVLEIETNRRPYCTKDGRFYLRIGAEKREATRAELSDLLDETRPLRYENIPVQNATEEDFDDGMLWSFADGFEDEFLGRNQYQTKEFLKKDLLLAFGNENNFSPTVGAILLFGKNERVTELVPRSGLTVVRYAGETPEAEIIEKIKLEGNLLSLYESSLRFIERYCDLLKFKPKKRKSEEKEVPIESRKNYHLYSILEGLVNCLIHRDLAVRDSETQILIFDNAIEFINPRRTNGFVPPASKAIRYGITQRVNPQIASIFTRREYGINTPRGGLPMIIRQSKLFSEKRVEIYTTNDKFRLKIHGR